MATAYSIEKKQSPVKLIGIPEEIVSKKNDIVIFDLYNQESDFNDLYEIFAQIVDDGQTYPQETTTKEEFQQYFLSHHCFVLRLKQTGQAVGAFYVKPNFPGRSSHICNYGVIVRGDQRGQGFGDLLVSRVSQVAKQIGYHAIYTNLVYVTNIQSIKLLKKYGYTQSGLLPKAGRLKHLGYVDAFQFYKALDDHND